MQRSLPFDELPEPFKRCSRCKVVKAVSEFHRDRKRRSGVQSCCRDCNIEVAKRFHAENAEHCRERIAKRARRILDENRRLLLEYLFEHPCVDCGEPDPVVLDFDHVTDEKLANVSELVFRHKAWEVIAAEIAKCEVVCANCHRRRTAIRAQTFRIRMRDRVSRPDNLPPGA
jgi:hypothetical protein